jgi:2-oxoglutarate ferredoxin oxidoreductase subunit alpha
MFPVGPRFAGLEEISDYRRYRLTADGISPRLYPGQSEHLVCVDSDEHDETGHITEDLRVVRPAMVEKRLKKIEGLKGEIALPEGYRLAEADTILIGWGSTQGAIREAVDRLCDRGTAIGALHFTEVWPLPGFTFPSGPEYVTVEGNATGQFAHLLSAGYGIRITRTIGRTDGLPITAEWLERRIDARAN